MATSSPSTLRSSMGRKIIWSQDIKQPSSQTAQTCGYLQISSFKLAETMPGCIASFVHMGWPPASLFLCLGNQASFNDWSGQWGHSTIYNIKQYLSILMLIWSDFLLFV